MLSTQKKQETVDFTRRIQIMKHQEPVSQVGHMLLFMMHDQNLIGLSNWRAVFSYFKVIIPYLMHNLNSEVNLLYFQ